MADKLTIFHGSGQVIERPTFGLGNPHNDYGLGFYCTESPELAREWGASEEADGFANRYSLDAKGLTELNLNDGSYTILHWLAVLLENRTFRVSGDIAPLARTFLLDRFSVDYHSYDLMRGYRADDSYFSFANAFLNNGLSLSRLERAMALGNLGEQVVVRSEKAFSRLVFEGFETADRTVYYPRWPATTPRPAPSIGRSWKLADLAGDYTARHHARRLEGRRCALTTSRI